MGQPSRKQCRTAVSKFQIRPALMPPQPSERNGALDARAEVVAATACREERRVDALDIDAAVLRRLNTIRDLRQPARGDIGIGEGTIRGEPHLRWTAPTHAPQV